MPITKRYERKYKFTELESALAKQLVQLNPSSFKVAYPDRWVNNIYFDTPDLTALNENLKGVSHRKKFRVRWYGETVKDTKNPILEVKIKENQLGWKKSSKIEQFDLKNLVNLSANTNQLLAFQYALAPKLINRYKRSYYTTSDNKFRITIDREMEYFSLLNAQSFTRFSTKEEGVILELKYDEQWEEQSEFVRQHLTFRQTKSSKYVTGMLAFR